MRRLSLNWLRIATHVGALVPLAILVWDALNNNLTVNPIQEISQRTGKIALVLLVLSLVCTPLNTVFGLRQALTLRRPLGLYAFAYTTLHLLNFAAVDYGLDPALLREAIIEKRYVLVGFAAFLLLLPLAITSTKGFQRRLGKRWKQLHRLVYAAALLAIVHYVWLVKADVREPLLYGAIVGGLLVLRIPMVRRMLTKVRQSWKHGRAVPRESTQGQRADNDLASSPEA
ncbi:MAG TPA: protein-methionine-sulfoxide reductase heme-binding subunit MsrQ [Herpetosiphonaceae bacterium]